MKITIIRHARVDYPFPKGCRPSGQIEAFKQYNISPIVNEGIYTIHTDSPIFISTLRRSFDTAEKVFGKKEFIRTGLLDEVPIMPFINANVWLPSTVWDICGRLAWTFRNGKQPERKAQTRARADQAIDMMEKSGQDCFAVSHAFFMHTLFRQLRKRGYRSKLSSWNIKNLQQFHFVRE
jgi:broad specificity phosphatase PhoE